MDGLELRVLGPLEIERAGRVLSPGSSFQRRLLAALVMAGGATVSIDRLIDLLWGHDPPPAARNSLQSHVARLRAAVGAPELLVTRPPGYALDRARVEVDAWRFEDEVERARREGARDARSTAGRLATALSWWRGEPYAEFTDEPAEREARRLDHLRVEARQLLAEAQLRAGDVQAAVDATTRLRLDEPLREDVALVAARALAAAGRSPEALDALRELRDRLADELGLDPSPAVAALEQRLLRGEVLVAAASKPADAGAREPEEARERDRLPRSARPAPPPRGGTPTVGREADRARIAAALTAASVVTLVGPGGVGKTRLAADVARDRANDSFPVAWVDLARVQDRADVGAAVVDALGAQVTDPADAQATAAAMARFRGLVVLDNCEHLLEAVTDLLDRALREPASVRLLTTSRERLDLPGEQVLVIEPLPVPDPAGATARDPAVALFLERVLAAGGEPIAPAHAAAVVAAVDGLPLGLELAAARAVTLPVETLVTRLAADLQVLAGSTRRYGDRQRTLVDVIAWSHDLLSDRERILFRRLSVFAAAFGLQDAERVAADAALPPPAVVDGLARLVEQSMVARVGPDRYRLLEPLRRFAADALAMAEDATATGRRHRELLVELVGRADVELPTRAEAATVVGLEQALPDLRAVHARALAAGDLGTVAQLAGQLYRFSYQQARGDLLAWGLPLVADGEGVPRDDRLRALTAATVVTQWRGDLDEARRLEALLAAVLHDEELAPWTGVHVAEAVGDVRLGLGDLEGAANAYARAGTLAGRLEHAGLLASATASLGIVRGFQGRVAEAERAAREACEVAAEAGAPSVRSLAAYALGEALAPSEPDAALDAFDLARREASTVGARFFEGIARTADVALRGRHGDPHEALNRYRDALQVWHDAAADSFVLTTLRNLVVLLVRVGADAAAVTLDAALGRFAPRDSYGPEATLLAGAITAATERLPAGAEAAARRDAASLADLGEAMRFGIALIDERAATVRPANEGPS
jgi:predicted ATPase/DNA-binding SARP family transcriptional activator